MPTAREGRDGKGGKREAGGWLQQPQLSRVIAHQHRVERVKSTAPVYLQEQTVIIFLGVCFKLLSSGYTSTAASCNLTLK